MNIVHLSHWQRRILGSTFKDNSQVEVQKRKFFFDEKRLNISITYEFTEGVIAFLVEAFGISKSQLDDWEMRLFPDKTAVLSPHLVVFVTVAAIAGICALPSYSTCALVRICGSCSTPILHFYTISWHPPAERISIEQKTGVKTFVFDKLLTVGRYCS